MLQDSGASNPDRHSKIPFREKLTPVICKSPEGSERSLVINGPKRLQQQRSLVNSLCETPIGSRKQNVLTKTVCAVIPGVGEQDAKVDAAKSCSLKSDVMGQQNVVEDAYVGRTRTNDG